MTREFDDDSLRSAYEDGLRDSSKVHRSNCPSAEALEAAVAGRGPETERLAVLDKALTCGACRREIALLHALASAEVRDGKTKTRGAAWKRLVPMALAASIILALGVVGVHKWGTQGAPDDLRGGNAVSLIEPSSDASVPRGAVRFAWRRVPSALRYTLEIDATDGRVLLSTHTIDTSLTLSLANVPAGEHRWLVLTSTDFGTELRSETRVLRVH
jgi:hypothetical protein